MKIGHISDLHYCPKHLGEVDRCTSSGIDSLIERGAELLVCSGDAIDHELDAHAPAFLALAKRFRAAADKLPILCLQGTLSHDYPGTVGLFRLLGGKFPIHVSERIEQVAWTDGGWIASESWRFDSLPPGTRMLFTCLPSVNRAEVAAKVGAAAASSEMLDVVAELLGAYAPINGMARAQGIPTMLVSHGTVSGSLTEHGVPMAGLDHEFTTGSLFMAGANAVALGHIHRYQSWREGNAEIAYPGSAGRLHFGEKGDKGVLLWDVESDHASHEFIKTPAREMQDITFPGVPDMEALATLASASAGQHVRIRWTVDAEHHASIDRDAILKLFHQAAEVKLEGRINPILRARTQGVSAQPTLDKKLASWAEATNTPLDGLRERLQLLQTQSPEAILATLLTQDGDQAMAA